MVEAQPFKNLKSPQGYGSPIIHFFVLTTILYLGAEILVPICVSLILYFLLSPLVRQSPGSSIILRWMTALALALCSAVIFASAIFLLATPTYDLFQTTSQNLSRLEKKLVYFKGPLKEFNDAKDRVEQLAQERQDEVQAVAVQDSSVSENIFGFVRSLISNFSLILLTLIFLLVYGDQLFVRIGRHLNFGLKESHEGDILRSVKSCTFRYLRVVATINVCLGLIVGTAYYFWGFPNPILWGIFVIVLNFVPYIGCFAGCLFSLLIGASMFDSFWAITGPPMTYLFISTLEGQMVTPLVLGSAFKINPLIIILAMLYWGFVWGIAGLFLAVPLLAIISIIASHSKNYNWITDIIRS